MSNINININGKIEKPKNKWIAILLCLFLGGIGAHKFYEEKKWNGCFISFILLDWNSSMFKRYRSYNFVI